MASVLALCFLLVVAVLQCSVIDAATDYCKICKESYGHVGCANPGFGPDCGHNPLTLKLLKEHRRALMAEINSWRDNVANGSYGLPNAVRMPVVSWDVELEYLAIKHTKGCVAETKKCRQTSRFWIPGQINYVFTGNGVPKRMLVIKQALKEWHSQRNRVTKELIAQYADDWPKGSSEGFRSDHNRSGCSCWMRAFCMGGSRKESCAFYLYFLFGYVRAMVYIKTGTSPGSQCSRKRIRVL
uniref:Predicted fibrinogenolytic enzyme 11 n=1 Tax=Tabanus yao TaxID=485572 RepID=C8YJB2_TABYA|nr:predicted fibrinogenolytic enzyme 11 [Tabanus yao]